MLFFNADKRSGMTAEINEAGSIIILKEIKDGDLAAWTHSVVGGARRARDRRGAPHPLHFLFPDTTIPGLGTIDLRIEGQALPTHKAGKAEACKPRSGDPSPQGATTGGRSPPVKAAALRTPPPMAASRCLVTYGGRLAR